MTDTNHDIDPKIIKTLSRKYDIQRVIGTGGMAIVYQAIQNTLDRKVALKVVHQNFVHDKEFIHRFTKEARVVASLNHPNIITIHDVDSVDQFHYMTMEYLSGQSLSELIRKNGKLGISEAIKIIIPIAKALNYLHSKGFIHRDVKSSNIFVCDDGRPVLMDFGIVYTSESMLSQPGTVLGTPEFMSPEQANGEELTGSSDLYSLGVILYECLTASMPFRTDNPLTTVYKVINEAPRPVSKLNPKVPEWLNSQILNLLSKDPHDRVASANLFIKNLIDRKEVPYDFKGLPEFKPVKDSGKKAAAHTKKINTGGGMPATSPVDQATHLNIPVQSTSGLSSRWVAAASIFAVLLAMIALSSWYLMGDQLLVSQENSDTGTISLTSENSLPYYPGGNSALQARIQQGIQSLNKDFKTGKVYIQAVIGINGEIQSMEVIQGIDEIHNTTAKSILKEVGALVPARRGGEAVTSEMVFMVDFQK